MYPGKWAALTPDKPAIIMSDTGETLTYAQLDERSIRLAHVFYDHGLRPGDSIALLAPNSPLYYEVYWAALRSGLYMTPINVQLAPAEAAYIIEDCGARAFIASAQLEPLISDLVPLTRSVPLRLSAHGPIDGYVDIEEAIAAASPVPFDHQPRGREMVYSAGTTGRPKGVKTPREPFQVHEDGADPLVFIFGPMYGWDPDTVYLSPAPLYHGAPLLYCRMVQSLGGTVIIMPKFDAVHSLKTIEKYRVTHSQWVPTMFIRMLKLPVEVRESFDLSSLKVAVHAAAPCPVDVKQAMIEWWGPILFEYYSSTEILCITMIDSNAWLQRPGSVGRSQLGVVHVCDEDGNELPNGMDGLLYFEHEVLPFQYHNDPEKTKSVQHPLHPNWGTAGDIGHVDDERYIYLTDRRAFTIISGGVNIYPQEVEDALALHPAVVDIAVFGVPDSEFGQRVMAVVQPSADVVPGPDLAQELTEFLRTRIAHYKIPRAIEFSDQLPRNAIGKLQKGNLVAAYS